MAQGGLYRFLDPAVDACGSGSHFSCMTENNDKSRLERDWALAAAATLGSAVRAKGILLEIRARLPFAVRKAVELRGAVIVLSMAEERGEEFAAVEAIVSGTLATIESMPVIPREIQDILAISTTERHRWLKDGRLQSAGTRTVKLRGRARQITFHVFDPAHVEDVLDRDLVASWREDDAERAAENRRRAAWKAKLSRARKNEAMAPSAGMEEPVQTGLIGWAEFERDGPLR